MLELTDRQAAQVLLLAGLAISIAAVALNSLASAISGAVFVCVSMFFFLGERRRKEIESATERRIRGTAS